MSVDIPRPRATSSTQDILRLNAPASFKAVALGCARVGGGRLTMRLPDGATLNFGDADHPGLEMIIRDYRFARRVVLQGDIGFADGYIAGEWETPDLAGLLTFLSANSDRFMNLFRGAALVRGMNFMRHLTRVNTRAGARRNIHEHYDLGNKFYAAWLDATMTYSSARFEKPGEALNEAQLNKYRALARHLDLQPGDRVLEIGCGWGGFAEVAASEYGAHVTGLTISQEQFEFATERLRRKGLAERTRIELKDYRDIDGPFDKVASIEMFEAVGERYWPTYFDVIARVLRPGGTAALQIITIRNDLFEAYRRRVDFIQRYIFPGGMLPSLQRLRGEVERAGLSWRRTDSFGQSYAETLAEWTRRFSTKWDEIRSLGFDERFRQLWRFYLGYCEAGFRSGRTDVVQIALAKP